MLMFINSLVLNIKKRFDKIEFMALVIILSSTRKIKYFNFLVYQVNSN